MAFSWNKTNSVPGIAERRCFTQQSGQVDEEGPVAGESPGSFPPPVTLNIWRLSHEAAFTVLDPASLMRSLPSPTVVPNEGFALLALHWPPAVRWDGRSSPRLTSSCDICHSRRLNKLTTSAYLSQHTCFCWSGPISCGVFIFSLCPYGFSPGALVSKTCRLL